MVERAPISVEGQNASLRRPFYKDIEELLCPGFLSHSYSLGPVDCCMRTPNPGDFMLLRARVGRRATHRDWMEWVVATCTWMVDGQSLLEDHQAVLKIRNALRSLSEGAVKSLFALFQGLYNRSSVALGRMEAYCYEVESRGLWRMSNRQSPGRDDFTGIPGTSRLGMNHAHRLWIAYNLAEDERLADLSEWNAAKLVASAHSPKGVKKLNDSEAQRQATEQDRRKQVQDRMYWEAVGDLDQAHRRKVQRAVTPTELVEDMRKWVAGEKDDHDKIIDAQKKKIQDRFNSEKQARDQRRRLLEAEQAMRLGASEELVGYTLEDLSRRTQDRPAGQHRAARVFEGGDPSRLYHKYVAQEAMPGRLEAGDGGVVTRTTKSLDSLLQDRQVKLKGGE